MERMSTHDDARPVARVVPAREVMEGAGVRVRRTIALPGLDHLDPFLLLDAFESDDPEDHVRGFPSHPHRGIETVTYMLEGRVRHADSMGNQGVIGPGDAQWMTAGRGIVHSEMPEQESDRLRGFQLWVNLPAAEKMCAPRYQDIGARDIPEVVTDGLRVRVLAGEHGGGRGPVRGIAVEPLYLDVSLEAGRTFSLPVARGHEAFAYVFEGSAAIGGHRVGRHVLAVLGEGERIEVAAGEGPVRLLLVAARPLGEPVVRWGPFVMNTEEEIARAIEDYSRGTLASSPG
jgi:redox-sensitive bicupin YhaK (pirin superfamily)